MIDTHTHLYLPEFDDDRDAVMQRAFDAGVEHLVLPNVDLTTVEPLRDLHAAYPDRTSMAMGLHPTEVGADHEDVMEQIEHIIAASPKAWAAIGEIGIDLYWDTAFAEEQMVVFDRQCRLATEMGLPVIIHCREGLDRTLEVVGGIPGLKGVFHSFGGSPADVDRVRRYGDFYFGINGIATFKNARLENTLCEITPSRLLLETDAPYLAPVPHRGRRNESSYIQFTLNHIASQLALSPAELDATTTLNARTLFHL